MINDKEIIKTTIEMHNAFSALPRELREEAYDICRTRNPNGIIRIKDLLNAASQQKTIYSNKYL